MTVKTATYKVDNGTTYDEIMFKTTAEQVFFTDGKTFQDKLNDGTLKGPTGPQGMTGNPGNPGLTTSVTVSGTNYTHSNGNITLPDYPTWETLESKPSISSGSGIGSIKEGNNTNASGDYSHSEGHGTTAKGKYAHAEGFVSAANGQASHVEGNFSIASGNYSHAEGSSNAIGITSHSEGHGTTANGNYSHAQGHSTVANGYAQTAIGTSNIEQGTATSKSSTDAAFIIGNGTGNSTIGTPSNAFRITWEGTTYGKGAYNTTGADYAEFFEWSDGNPNNEERLGYFVTFEKGAEKIRIANDTDNYILGIVSASAAIVGDNYDEEWKNKYLTDEWGRIQYEMKKYPEELDEEGNVIVPAYTVEEPIINPEFLTRNVYVSRKDRQEWSVIGLFGKILVYDDGTCNIGDFCKPNENGIATKSDTGYYVMSRESKNIIRILFK